MRFLDYFPLVLSALSLLVSAAAFVRSINLDRRRTLIDLHSRFISPESSSQRRELHAAHRQYGALWHEHIDADMQSRINSTMALLDAMAMQVSKRHVPTREATPLWGRAMWLCWDKAHGYVAYRRALDNPGLWIYLEDFVQKLPHAMQNPSEGQSSTTESEPADPLLDSSQ